MKRFLAVLTVIAVLLGFFPSAASAEATELSGICGENVTWSYSRLTHTLTVSGTGPMYDYSEDSPAPWANEVSLLYCNVEDGVTRIGDYAFANLHHAGRNIRVAASVREVGSKAFAWGNVIVLFFGSAPSMAQDVFDQSYGRSCYIYGWEPEALQNYGGDMSWEKCELRQSDKTKTVYLRNEPLLPSDFSLDMIYNGGLSYTYTPQLLQTEAYDNSTLGTKQVQVTADTLSFTHSYIVSDGQSHLDTVRVKAPAYAYYTGQEIYPEPEVTAAGIPLIRNIHYEVSYRNNREVGSDAKILITGLGEWAGLSKTVSFRILKQNIAEKDFYANNEYFDGLPKEPYITPALDYGTEAVLLLKNNIRLGTAQYRLVGLGNYYGSAEGTFEILGTQSLTLNGVYTGMYDEPLSSEVHYDEAVIYPGKFTGVINSIVGSTDYRHYAYYELYRMDTDALTLITTHETALGRGTDTAFVYDFSGDYAAATEGTGVIYLLSYSWLDTHGRIFSGICALYVLAAVPDATQMVIAMLEDSGDFRKAYFTAYGLDGDLGEVTWTSSDPGIAEIDDGVATLKRPGTVTFTVQQKDMQVSLELTVPERLLTDCEILGYSSETGTLLLSCGQILLTEGTDYIQSVTQDETGTWLTLSGTGLFSGQLRFLSDPEGLHHTHLYDGCLDPVCDLCGCRRPAEHTEQGECLWDSTCHWSLCGICGEKLGEEAHRFDNDRCLDCGCTVSLLPGDLNGDGKLNNRDVTRLMQYLAGWDVALSGGEPDLNGDGKVNNKDVTRLMQYLADWDVALN